MDLGLGEGGFGSFRHTSSRALDRPKARRLLDRSTSLQSQIDEICLWPLSDHLVILGQTVGEGPLD